MATNANPAPTEKVQASPKLTAAIQACVKADVSAAIALDGYRNIAKSETVRLALADKKALTAVLFASGDSDARRISEVVGFVFPASDSARKELDKAMEKNAKETDPKKRIAKPVILALQRDKTGKLTLEKALKEHTLSRTPGGKTDQTETKKKKLTPKEIEEELGNLMAAAIAYGKEHEYDADDLTQVFEDSLAAAEETTDEDEAETEETED